MTRQSLESSHQNHREVHQTHDNTNHQANREAAHHLTGEHGVDHKNLSKLPTNQAAENATPKLELHDPSKEATAAKSQTRGVDAPQTTQAQSPESRPDASKPVGDAPKPAADAAKPEFNAAQKFVADEMVSDLKNKNMEGQLSKRTTDDIQALGEEAVKKGGAEGLKQFNDSMGKAFDKAQTDAGVPPASQKKFQAGTETGKWQDYSLTRPGSNVKDTAGFSHDPLPQQPAAPAETPGGKRNEYFPGS
ncbi:MAG TPA: hypothetical protein V6C97_12060 [Oculatellaceae cyanobacterium]